MVSLIAGVTGRDGVYVADFLVNMGYVVHGIERRITRFNTVRVDHCLDAIATLRTL